MRKSTILAALLAVTAISCQKESLQEPEYLGNFTVRASREACIDTKASVSSADGKFTWSKGDAIGIYNGSTFDKLMTGDADGSASATFRGFVTGTAQDYAVFPYKFQPKYSESKLTVTLPASYEWKANEANTPMLATFGSSSSNSLSLSFKHLGGLVKVTVNNMPTNVAKFVFNTDKDITGAYEVSNLGSATETQQISSAGNAQDNEVTFTFTAGAVADMDFYIPVPVGDYVFGFKLLDAEGNEILAKEGSTVNSVGRATLLVMPPLTCTSASGGGESSTVRTTVPAGYVGNFYLPDTKADVVVNIAGDCSDPIALVYAENAVNKPVNVTVNAGDYKISSLTITLPNSHVDVVGGTYTKVTAETSLKTLVLGQNAKIEKQLAVIGGSAEIAGSVAAVSVSKDVPVEASIIIAPTAKDIATLEVAGGGKIEIAAPVSSVTIAESVPAKAEINVTKEAKVESLAVTVGNVSVEGTVASVTVNAASAEASEEAKAATPVIWVTGQVTGTLTNNNANAAVVAESNGSEGSNIAAMAGDYKTVKSPSDFLKDKFTAGGTIDLEQDITGEFNVTKTVILNLNGHSISSSASETPTIIVAETGNLTVNGGEKGQISHSSFWAIKNNGELTLNQGRYIGGTAVYNYKEATFNGGYYKGSHEAIANVNSVAVFSNSITYDASYSASIYKTNISFGKGVSLPRVYASSDEEPGDKICSYVADETALRAALADNKVQNIILNEDIALAKTIELASGSKAIIDLNSNRLSAKSSALYKSRIAIFAVNGGELTVKSGFLGDDAQKNFYGIYSGSSSSFVEIEDVEYGKNVTYAFNGSGKLEATGCAFYGWLSGWHQGGTFNDCAFNIGKAYYAAAICYGNTKFDNCRFFKNGVNADEYSGPDSDGYYRHNYVVAACTPAENISFTGCKFFDASLNTTDVTVANHPYHDKDCPEGWGDGKAVAGIVTVDGVEVTTKCLTLVSTVAQLKAAFADGGNIKLMSDLTVSESIELNSGKQVNLNLNGKTVDGTGVRAFVVNGGDLTIGGNGKMIAANKTGDNNAILNVYSGKLTLNEMYMEGANACIAVTGGTAYINDATVKALNGGCCVHASSSGVVNVNGMTFTCGGDDPDGPGACWARDGGTINIYDGTFNAAPLNNKTHELEVLQANYCLFDFTGLSGYNAGNINVYGGTFLDFNPASNFVDHSFLADGYEVVQDGTTYTVRKASAK